MQKFQQSQSWPQVPRFTLKQPLPLQRKHKTSLSSLISLPTQSSLLLDCTTTLRQPSVLYTKFVESHRVLPHSASIIDFLSLWAAWQALPQQAWTATNLPGTAEQATTAITVVVLPMLEAAAVAMAAIAAMAATVAAVVAMEEVVVEGDESVWKAM